MWISKRGCKKGGRTREGEMGGREWEREYEGRSLQKCQAMVHFSRQLKWGQGEERKKGEKEKKNLFGFIELFLLQVEKHFGPYLGSETVCYFQSVLKSVFASITHASAPQSWSSVSLLAKLHSNKQIFTNNKTVALQTCPDSWPKQQHKKIKSMMWSATPETSSHSIDLGGVKMLSICIFWPRRNLCFAFRLLLLKKTLWYIW